nr:translocation/assembly module TamB domain-containing protein [Thermomonas flagellata]
MAAAAVGALLLAAGLGLLLSWLLGTASGRDALLAQVVARLPPGASLTWRAAEGPLAGPLLLRGVRLTLPRPRDARCRPTPQAPCATGTLVFTADTLRLQPALRPLLARTLRLQALEVRGARLQLPRDDTPFELPRWPQVLPQIALPLTLEATAIRIEDLRVLREDAPLLHVRSASGALQAGDGWLRVPRLQADTDRGQFRLQGEYRPRENFRSDLVATAVLPAPAGHSLPRLGLVMRGDLARMDVALAGRLPGPTRATLTLRGDPAAPRWQLRADSAALDPGLLAGGDAGTPWTLALSADGRGGAARVQGRLAQGATTLVLQPSQLRLEDQRLQLQPLVVDLLGGRVTAHGEADLRDPAAARVRLALNARGLRWASADGTTTLVGDADLGVAGRLDRWGVHGQARLQRGREQAVVDLDGHGDRDGMRIAALQARMPQGRLQAQGTLAWAPRLAWQAQAQLDGFDPGYFVPDWPGALRGALRSRGQVRADGRLQAEVEARPFGGQLRRRPLSGQALLAIDGDAYRGELALALGASRVQARGSLAQALSVDARLAPLRLDDLLPGGHGQLDGQLRLRGTRRAPEIAADLSGRGLAWRDLRAERLRLHGALPWARGDGRLQLDLQGLQAGLPLTALQADLRGAVERLQAQLAAESEHGRVQLRGHAARGARGWSGQLESLALAPATGPDWSLRAPAAWQWDGARGTLAPACLAARGGGELCVSADWPRQGLGLQGQALPLALLAAYLPERAPGEPWALSGSADLRAGLRPTATGWRGEARVVSATGGLRMRPRARRDVLGYHDFTLEATFDPHRLQAIAYAGLDGNGALTAQLATGWDAQAPLDGLLRVRTEALTFLELFSPDIVDPSGSLDVSLQLGGSRAQPRLAGEGRLQRFAAEVPALGISLTDGDVQLDAQPDGSARIDGRVRSGSGTLTVTGSLGWRGDDTPLQLQVSGRDVLLADTRQLRAVASPELQVRYRSGQPLTVSGRVQVPSAQIHLERLEMAVTPSPDVVVLDPADPRQAPAAPLRLDLDLALELGKDVRLDGYGLKGSLAGTLQVRQVAGGGPRGTGVLEVDGRYRAYGQDLQITRGRLLWANSDIADPRLDIQAERSVGDVTAGIKVEGLASAPQATVYSDPSMTQSETLAYLTLGRPLPSLSSSELQQVDMARSALNAGVGLLTAQLGTRLGLDDAGIMQSRALGGEVLGVGKYLSPRLYVSYGVAMVGNGQVLLLKYLLRKGFDIQIESSTFENRASLNWRKEK